MTVIYFGRQPQKRAHLFTDVLFTTYNFYAIIFLPNNFQKLFLRKAVRGLLQLA